MTLERAERSNWPGVLSIAAAIFLLVTSEFLPVGLLGHIATSYGVSEGAVGLAVTIPGLVACLAAPLFTVVAGRVDRRLLIIGLTLMIVASNAVVLVAPDLETMLVGRVLLGIGVGGVWTFAASAGRRLVTEASGGRATSLIVTGVSIGSVVGVPLGVLVGELAGWRAAFGVAVGFGALVVLSQMLLLPALKGSEATSIGRLFGLLSVGKARVGLLAILFIASGQFAAYTYLEPWLRVGAELDAGQVTLALVTYGVAGIVGTFGGELLAARNVRAAYAAVCAALGAVILVAAFAGPSVLGALVLVGLWGLVFGAVPVVIQIYMYMADPARFEGSSALMVAAFQVALATGAWIGGVVFDASGVRAAMTLGAVLCLAAAGVVLTSRRRRPPVSILSAGV